MMAKLDNGIVSLVCITFVATFIFRPTTGLFIDNSNDINSSLQSENGRRVRLFLYTGSSISDSESTSFSGNMIGNFVKQIVEAKPFVTLYIHGFQESPFNESVRTVANAYLKRGDHTFLLVDWSDYASDNYLLTLSSVKRIAKALAALLDRLVANGFDSETLHIVGHSMGAQMAGFIGRFTTFEVPRISGLDPASPGYYQFNAEHLNPTNARFVDVIHTDGGFYGAYPATGTADCFPNGGTRPQPGCSLIGFPLTPKDLCSHWRSWRFWAESVLNEKAFLAVKYSSYASFLNKPRGDRETTYCGYAMPNTRSLDQGIRISQNNPEELIKTNDLSKPTMVFIHGWHESCYNNSAIHITSAFISRGYYNVYCLDWSSMAGENLVAAVQSMSIVSKIVSSDFNRMSELGLFLEKTWIIGFSLGAHIAGQIGANIIAYGISILGRITGLDAALPFVYIPSCHCHTLEANDAIFVDVIHTDAGIYGVDQAVGHVDVYVNKGTRLQPGCPLLPSSSDLSQLLPTYRCSHDMSWIQYADACTTNGSLYIARKCDSYASYRAGLCENNPLIKLCGNLPDRDAIGTYYITTNAEAPHGRGIAGASP
ncbi:uncharacterized protein LOC105691990 [Athalia rosae]|uniref:uncharacterized protein LOC105691990 n=1 Tax=Athalia rosae TaxID=37344 RepID=UPI002033BC8A|nr:uncharacterized protein LOC105691990 [Athalia rosae]